MEYARNEKMHLNIARLEETKELRTFFGDLPSPLLKRIVIENNVEFLEETEGGLMNEVVSLIWRMGAKYFVSKLSKNVLFQTIFTVMRENPSSRKHEEYKGKLAELVQTQGYRFLFQHLNEDLLKQYCVDVGVPYDDVLQKKAIEEQVRAEALLNGVLTLLDHLSFDLLKKICNSKFLDQSGETQEVKDRLMKSITSLFLNTSKLLATMTPTRQSDQLNIKLNYTEEDVDDNVSNTSTSSNHSEMEENNNDDMEDDETSPKQSTGVIAAFSKIMEFLTPRSRRKKEMLPIEDFSPVKETKEVDESQSSEGDTSMETAELNDSTESSKDLLNDDSESSKGGNEDSFSSDEPDEQKSEEKSGFVSKILGFITPIFERRKPVTLETDQQSSLPSQSPQNGPTDKTGWFNGPQTAAVSPPSKPTSSVFSFWSASKQKVEQPDSSQPNNSIFTESSRTSPSYILELDNQRPGSNQSSKNSSLLQYDIEEERGHSLWDSTKEPIRDHIRKIENTIRTWSSEESKKQQTEGAGKPKIEPTIADNDPHFAYLQSKLKQQIQKAEWEFEHEALLELIGSPRAKRKASQNTVSPTDPSQPPEANTSANSSIEPNTKRRKLLDQPTETDTSDEPEKIEGYTEVSDREPLESHEIKEATLQQTDGSKITEVSTKHSVSHQHDTRPRTTDLAKRQLLKAISTKRKIVKANRRKQPPPEKLSIKIDNRSETDTAVPSFAPNLEEYDSLRTKISSLTEKVKLLQAKRSDENQLTKNNQPTIEEERVVTNANNRTPLHKMMRV